MGALPSLRFIYEVGLSMNPLMWENLPQSIYTHYSILTRAIHSLLYSHSIVTKTANKSQATMTSGLEHNSICLHGLMKHISKLPLELVDIIWKRIPPSTTRCLLSLSAARETWPAVNAYPASATIRLEGDIHIYQASVMDGTYITGICIDGKVYGYQSNRLLRLSYPSSAAIFTFTLGRSGLQRLGILPKATEELFSSRPREEPEYLGVIHSQLPPQMELTWDVWHHTI